MSENNKKLKYIVSGFIVRSDRFDSILFNPEWVKEAAKLKFRQDTRFESINSCDRYVAAVFDRYKSYYWKEDSARMLGQIIDCNHALISGVGGDSSVCNFLMLFEDAKRYLYSPFDQDLRARIYLFAFELVDKGYRLITLICIDDADNRIVQYPGHCIGRLGLGLGMCSNVDIYPVSNRARHNIKELYEADDDSRTISKSRKLLHNIIDYLLDEKEDATIDIKMGKSPSVSLIQMMRISI